MNNFYKYKEKTAFHPGYYIQEWIEYNDYTQEEFAKRIGTTPKNLSILIRGGERISIDMAVKLSRITGTSIQYWFNLQTAYDTLIAEKLYDEELAKEKEILGRLGYDYFRKNCSLDGVSQKKEDKVDSIRNLLDISSLTLLEKQDTSISLRSSRTMNDNNILKANSLILMAVNETRRTECARYSRKSFIKAVDSALTETTGNDAFLDRIKSSFLLSGVVLVVLPDIKGSRLNGASRIVGNKVMLLITDKNRTVDNFFFTLFHEIGHILSASWGVSMDDKENDEEKRANIWAENMLIPEEQYYTFFHARSYDRKSIISFASSIGRDPGIVVSRLQKDGVVSYSDTSLNSLKRRCTLIPERTETTE